MKFLLIWHKFIVKHFVIVNIILLITALFFAADLMKLPFDADWLNLFSKEDPIYTDYQRLASKDRNPSTVFLKLDGDQAHLEELIGGIGLIKGVSFIRNVDLDNGGAGGQWLEAGLQALPALSNDEEKAVVAKIERYLQAASVNYGITGAIPILSEFTESVRSDFINTSLVALAFIVTIIFFFFGFSRAVIFGFIYQGIGLLAALFVFKRIYGSLNPLAATLPCVLLGLGIDFVIHSVSAAGNSSGVSRGSYSGEAIYRKVSVPIFWGAVTTAMAFASFLFADLKGLHSAGVLGSLGVIGMFAVVILFLPAAVSRFGGTDGHNRVKRNIVLPWIGGKRPIGAILLILICLGLVSFAGRVRFEDRVENLYNKEMVTLRLQEELTRELGVYPSKLFIAFESKNPKVDLLRLAGETDLFVPNPQSVGIKRSGSSDSYDVIAQIFPRKNPFDLRNFEALRDGLEGAFTSQSQKTLRISGDSVLNHHLNLLLVRGIGAAFLAVLLFLGLVLAIFFRKIGFVIATLAVLLISTLTTLGGFGLFSISLSVYTITLFPLFIGIGIDDCLHILYLKQKGGRLAAGSSVFKAITLTTVTTLLCYGSLMTAKNGGFNSMGQAAVLGLTLIFFCAIYLLPALLNMRMGRGVNNGGRENEKKRGTRIDILKFIDAIGLWR